MASISIFVGRQKLTRGLRTSVALVTLIGLGACGMGSNGPFSGPGGLIHPQIGPMNYSDEYIYDSKRPDTPGNCSATDSLKAFGCALIKAEQLDNKLYDAMWWNDTYGFITGVGMFGAGLATLAFGVFDSSRALLLGAGVTTAGFAGVRQFYPFAARNALYSKGRVALQCAVEATQTAVFLSEATKEYPATGLDAPRNLDEVLDGASHAASVLNAEVAASTPINSSVPREVTRQLWLQSASTSANSLSRAVESARIVQAEIQPAVQTATLNAVVMRIHALVDTHANDLAPDPDGALRVARERLQTTLTDVRTAALNARDEARKVDNQKPAAAPTNPTNQQAAAANAAQAAKAATQTQADAAKAAAEVQAADAAKVAAEAKVSAAGTDNSAKAAANTELAAATRDKAEAEGKAIQAQADAQAATQEKIKAEAATRTPTDNAAFWADVLATRMQAIAEKLKNIDSCTATLNPTTT